MRCTNGKKFCLLLGFCDGVSFQEPNSVGSLLFRYSRYGSCICSPCLSLRRKLSTVGESSAIAPSTTPRIARWQHLTQCLLVIEVKLGNSSFDLPPSARFGLMWWTRLLLGIDSELLVSYQINGGVFHGRKEYLSLHLNHTSREGDGG